MLLTAVAVMLLRGVATLESIHIWGAPNYKAIRRFFDWTEGIKN